MDHSGHAPSDLALLVLRLVVGLFFVAHGANKVIGGLDGTARWFASIGMKWPKWQARAAAGTEVGAGLMLAAGLLTPLAAAAVTGVMLVAIVVAHRRSGFFVFNQGQGWEYCATIAAVATAIGVAGPGRWSIDQALGIDPDTWGGTWGSAVITVAAALVSAGLLLATSYRPAARA